MLYPRYMVVNKNRMKIDAIDKDEGSQTFEGLNNYYLNTQRHDSQR